VLFDGFAQFVLLIFSSVAFQTNVLQGATSEYVDVEVEMVGGGLQCCHFVIGEYRCAWACFHISIGIHSVHELAIFGLYIVIHNEVSRYLLQSGIPEMGHILCKNNLAVM
jgi:hypothetical protein